MTPALAKSVNAEQPRPVCDTIEVELASRGLTLTLRWPGGDPQGLANWTRALLT